MLGGFNNSLTKTLNQSERFQNKTSEDPDVNITI
jgi:hypothetical protein